MVIQSTSVRMLKVYIYVNVGISKNKCTDGLKQCVYE